MVLQAVIKANYVCKNFFPGGRLRCFMTCKAHKGHRYGDLLPHTGPASLFPSCSPRVTCRTGSPLLQAVTQNPVWQERRGESSPVQTLLVPKG